MDEQCDVCGKQFYWGGLEDGPSIDVLSNGDKACELCYLLVLGEAPVA